MPSLTALLSKWPLIRQIRERTDGTGLEAMSDKTRAMHARIDDAQVARSVCPYCGVGCGQLIYHKDGKLVSIEGDPESPISQGNLCPKGAASYQLLTHSRRETKMKYRAPRAKEWTEISLDRAVDMVELCGRERIWMNCACDWGVSDPLAVPKAALEMRQRGHSAEFVDQVLYQNPHRFLSQCPKFRLAEPSYG